MNQIGYKNKLKEYAYLFKSVMLLPSLLPSLRQFLSSNKQTKTLSTRKTTIHNNTKTIQKKLKKKIEKK